MAEAVLIRMYTGENQEDAALLYAEDAPRMAADGWTPISHVWVAGEWPTSMWVVATVLVVVGIGIVLLFAMAFFKPMRTLLVTYRGGSGHAPTDA
ncbi:MAG: hypothetical protein M3473_05805 [Chloroflexota bacterium]|nr:hypothetical protein [Chloroflexota bacterium]